MKPFNHLDTTVSVEDCIKKYKFVAREMKR
jgi:hypothetical protein